MEDHYATLGVSENATQDEIKQAFRKLAKEHHPDRNPGDASAEEKFKRINAAYAEIGESDARARYDQQRRFGGGPGGNTGFGPQGFHFNFGGFGDFDDMFSQIFAQHGFHRPQAQPRNRDFTFNLNLTLEEAFSGKQTPVQFGVKGQNYNINVSIPAGVESGTRIRYQGHGDRSIPNAPPGDLYIQIHVDEHPQFKRNGPHLHTTLDVDALEAICGCEKDLVCIDGQTVRIKIPPGTQPNGTMRLRERGMPVRAGGNPRGDCMVSIQVRIPVDLAESDMEMLREMIARRST